MVGISWTSDERLVASTTEVVSSTSLESDETDSGRSVPSKQRLHPEASARL